MLYSSKFNFIKINIPNTGNRLFYEYFNSFIDINTTGHILEYSLNSHLPARKLKTLIEKQNLNWDDYFSFTIIRNPWDRYMSLLYYYKFIVDEHKKAATNNIDIEKTWLLDTKKIALKYKEIFEILNFDLSKILQYIIIDLPSQSYYITQDSNILLKYVGKFENIKYEFDYISSRIGLNISKIFDYNQNNNKELENKELYTQHLIDLVAEKERLIIEKYGYQFK